MNKNSFIDKQAFNCLIIIEKEVQTCKVASTHLPHINETFKHYIINLFLIILRLTAHMPKNII